MWLSWMHSPDQISQSETKRQIILKALKAVAEAVVVCCDSDANLFDMSVLRFWRGLIFNDTFRFIFIRKRFATISTLILGDRICLRRAHTHTLFVFDEFRDFVRCKTRRV